MRGKYVEKKFCKPSEISLQNDKKSKRFQRVCHVIRDIDPALRAKDTTSVAINAALGRALA